jgi:hypothetical protein
VIFLCPLRYKNDHFLPANFAIINMWALGLLKICRISIFELQTIGIHIWTIVIKIIAQLSLVLARIAAVRAMENDRM